MVNYFKKPKKKVELIQSIKSDKYVILRPKEEDILIKTIT
jgi:hypothetical protein